MFMQPGRETPALVLSSSGRGSAELTRVGWRCTGSSGQALLT